MNILENLDTLYNSRAQQFKEQENAFSKTSTYLSTTRVLLFATALIMVVYFANLRNGEAIFLTSFTFAILFGITLKYHIRINRKKIVYQNLVKINHDEILRLQGNFKSFDKGNRFSDQLHPYTKDLDIFGENSVFQLLNRNTTEASRIKLAQWLKTAATKEEILERQKAVAELANMLEWRQEFSASAFHFDKEEVSAYVLINWLREKPVTDKPLLYKTLGYIMPILFFFSVYMFFFQEWSGYFILAVMGVNTLILRRFLDAAKNASEKASEGSNALRSNFELIRKIENQSFGAKYLKNLQEKFTTDSFCASVQIRKLYQLLDFLDSRSNMFFMVLDSIFLIDIHLLLKTDQWKSTNKKYIEGWFDALSSFEVLVSMAGYGFSNPDYTYPIIKDEEHILNGKSIGHPLIKKGSRVKNDFELSGKGHIALITGSNMAGKSTFLRTVGVNKVLALSGAPVCAEYFETSVDQVFTSMRTEDNLEESVSSFYAELRRLKQLLDILQMDKPVIFMLDEILKGTNSIDRHKGAKSLIRQLSKLNASGLVSTHDLELGELATGMKNIVNYSFNSDVVKDEILFDYKLHHGICKSFNASKLMQKMGIDIET